MSGTLAISVSAWPSHALVTVTGECDLTTAPQLLDALSSQAWEHERLVIVDLSALGFLDVAGVRALLEAGSALAGRGRSLVLASPQPIVSRILELTHAGHLVSVCPDVAEALATDRRP